MYKVFFSFSLVLKNNDIYQVWCTIYNIYSILYYTKFIGKLIFFIALTTLVSKASYAISSNVSNAIST